MAYGIFDAHCDTLTTLGTGDNLYDVKRDFNFKQVEGYDYFTQVMALWVDIARDGEKVDDKVQTFIKRFYIELEKNPSVKHIKTKEDIANLQKGVNVILGIEGGEAVGRDISNVEKPLSDRCETSITMPRRFISRTTSFPKCVRPPL